jgi:hypothetical protein
MFLAFPGRQFGGFNHRRKWCHARARNLSDGGKIGNPAGLGEQARPLPLSKHTLQRLGDPRRESKEIGELLHLDVVRALVPPKEKNRPLPDRKGKEEDLLPRWAGHVTGDPSFEARSPKPSHPVTT